MENLTALNPWFLLGALAALVPLLIHLIERRRVKRVVFGSVLFLRGLVKRLARRRRTSELILLLLRMTLVAVLAVAFARPFFRSSDASAAGAGDGQRAVAILVDRSVSMKIAARMEEARKRALEVVESLRPGDVAAVYVCGAHAEALIPWTADHDAARVAVEKIAATDESADLAAALREASQAAGARGEPARSVVVISDLQASGWAKYAADWTFPDGVDLRIERVGGETVPPNVGIVKLAVPALAVVGSGEELLTAQVRNYTAERRSVTVHLKLAGEEIDKREISIPLESSLTVSFRHAFDEPGQMEGRFVLTVSDGFPADDRAGFVVEVKPKIGVVLVNGSNDPDPKRNDGYFLKRALAPAGESIFSVTEVTPDDFQRANLADVGVVVLADVDDLPGDGLRKLAQYVNAGGGLLIFPGTQTNPANFNRRFGGIAPCLLEREIDVLGPSGGADAPAGSRRPVTMTEVDFAHPVFRAFAGPHHGDFGRVAFNRYFSVSDSQAAQVIARFGDGRPAALLKSVGRGASMMVVSGADVEMNNFALRAVFLPFVHEAARHLSAFGATHEAWVSAGSEIVAVAAADAPGAQLTSPSGETRTVEIAAAESADGGRFVRFVPTEQGLYRLEAGPTRLFAVNVDAAEGDLVCMRADEIAASLTARRGSDASDGALVVEGHVATDEDIERSQRLGWMLLLAAAALMAAEMTLARRIAAAQ